MHPFSGGGSPPLQTEKPFSLVFSCRFSNRFNPVMFMKKVFFIALILGFLSLILLFPEGVKSGVDTSLSLCAHSLLPSLFPFMVMSNFIVKSGILPPSPFILGAVGGYPLGAQVVCDLYKNARITKRDAETSLCYASLPSPGFILGAIGALYGFKKAVFLLFFNIFTAWLIKRISPENKAGKAAPSPFSSSFVSAVKDGFFSFLAVCAFVIFFTVLSEVLGCLWNIPVFLRGFLEMSSGVFLRPSFPLAAFFCSFGGVCVHFQTLSLCAEAGIPCKKHFYTKIIQGILAAIFAYSLTFFDI